MVLGEEGGDGGGGSQAGMDVEVEAGSIQEQQWVQQEVEVSLFRRGYRVEKKGKMLTLHSVSFPLRSSPLLKPSSNEPRTLPWTR